MAIESIGPGIFSKSIVNPPRSGGETFASAMTEFLREVNRDQITAANKIKDLVIDGRGSIHDTMTAVTTAEGSIRLLMEMRNRLVDGVNRLLQTQV